MFVTKNDLDPAIHQEAIELLNDRLADCIDLHTQVKHAHWNVKGPEFIALHRLFDEINNAVVEYVDIIAECAVQLGELSTGRLVRLPSGAAYLSIPRSPWTAANTSRRYRRPSLPSAKWRERES